MWTDDVDPDLYSEFLKKVYRRITVKKKAKRSGVEKLLPRIRLVFPEEME